MVTSRSLWVSVHILQNIMCQVNQMHRHRKTGLDFTSFSSSRLHLSLAVWEVSNMKTSAWGRGFSLFTVTISCTWLYFTYSYKWPWHWFTYDKLTVRIQSYEALHPLGQIGDNRVAILWSRQNTIFAGSFKSQLIDYFRGHIVFWEAFCSFMLIRTKWRFWTSWRHFGCTLWSSQLLCLTQLLFIQLFPVFLQPQI